MSTKLYLLIVLLILTTSGIVQAQSVEEPQAADQARLAAESLVLECDSCRAALCCRRRAGTCASFQRRNQLGAG